MLHTDQSDDLIPRAKLVKLGEHIRGILKLHKQRSGLMAEMIRGCVARVQREPYDRITVYTSHKDQRRMRQEDRDERAAAWAYLRQLCEMLEQDATGVED